MNVTIRHVGYVTILDCDGKLSLGEGTIPLRNEVRKCIKNERKNLILNLENVNYIDGSGLGELVNSFTTVHNSKGHLILLRVSRKIRELLEVTKLLVIFDIFDDEKAALDSFVEKELGSWL